MGRSEEHLPTLFEDMKQPVPTINSRISDTVHFEAYFDLWGFSLGWIKAICDALHNFCDCSQDTAESYQCEACMAFRFTSQSFTRTEQAKKIFRRLANLATAEQRNTLAKTNRKGEMRYKLQCG